VVTDSLTGIYNRRFFDDSYASALKQAKRQQSALSLFMIDIDFFKQYNDHYGHMAGDKALKAVANALGGQMMRSTDVFARYGGEEFIILTSRLQSGTGRLVCRKAARLRAGAGNPA